MNVEINPIAITSKAYNVHIANLIDHLLILDQKTFEADKASAGVA